MAVGAPERLSRSWPHVSGDTPEGWQAGIDLFCDNLRLYLAGHPERMGNLLDLPAYL